MKLPTVIGITGRKYNGKDTVADYLVSRYGYTKLSFAQPIKEMSKIIFGFTEQQVNGNLKEDVDERWHISPRQAMQFIGTELFRDHIGKLLPHIGNNIWVYCATQKIKTQLSIDPNAKFVIADVRFPNELESLRGIFDVDGQFKSIRVSRPTIACDETSLHESEKLIDTLVVDHELLNDSGKQELYDKVDQLIN